MSENLTKIGVAERGRLHANPDRAIKDQMVAISKDACGDPAYGEVGRDVIKGIDGDLINIQIDGVTHTFDSPVDYTDEDAVQTAVEEALAEKGAQSEYNIWVKVVYDGATTSITHDGRRTINRVQKSGPTSFNGTRTTDIKTVCKYRIDAAVGAMQVSYDGSTEVLANSPYSHSGTSGTDATTAGQIATDLGNALDALGLSKVGDPIAYKDAGAPVEVEVNNPEEAFDIVFYIEMPAGDVTFNGDFISPVVCTPEVV